MIIAKALNAISTFVSLRNFMERGDYDNNNCAMQRGSTPIGMKDYIVGSPTPCVEGTAHCADKAATGFDYEVCEKGQFVPKKCPCPKETCRPGGLFYECEDLTRYQNQNQGQDQSQNQNQNQDQYQGQDQDQGQSQDQNQGPNQYQVQASSQEQAQYGY